MRKLWLASAVVVASVATHDSLAQAPGEIGQQGILTDSVGNPIASGTFDLTFRLYAEGEGGSELWTEMQTVTVDEGLYTVQLGSLNPIGLPFTEPYWLGISVDEGEEMAPRLRLTAAPYARRANSVDTVAASSILDRSITTRKLSSFGGATGQILTVGGDTVGWSDPEQITGAALPNKSVRAVKLNSQDADGGMILLAAGLDSVVWGRIGTSSILDESVTADKISSASSGNGRVLVDVASGAEWGQVGTGALQDRAVTESKISAAGGAAGQILTVDGDSAAWRDPAGLAPGSITYDRLSADGGSPGELLAVVEGDTTGWIPLVVETPNLADRAVTAAKVSGTGGQNGQVLTRAGNGAEWSAIPPVDPGSFANGSVGLNKLQTNGASSGNHLIFDGSVPSWQDAPALPLPFFGETDGSDPTSFRISSPITFSAQDPIEEAYAIHGVMTSSVGGPRATGLRGENRATSAFGIGVWGSHDGGGWGVYGTTPSGLAIYGSSLDGHAGFFDGRVTIIGTLQKSAGSFTIDHPLDPENKTLSHSFVESPDMMNIYNGNVTIGSEGTAVVTLPEWFDALNRDFRYQLTPIGGPGPNLHVADEISGNTFVIGGGTPGMRVSWQVTGIRDDAYARTNPIVVEENKPAELQGRYLNPEAFGLSRDRSAAPSNVEGVDR